MEAAHDRLGTRRRREAARGSPREHEFTADTSYKIDACLSAAAQAKKIDHTQNGAKTRTARRSAHAALSGPARDAATLATRGRGRRALAPARLQRSQTAAALRQCSRVRGLPDADDTPRHATDSSRHARHPACSDAVAQC